jgi:hypothetical protein
VEKKMKKIFLVVLMVGAFVGQAWGAEQPNQEAIVSSLQNYLDFVGREDITPLLAPGQVVKRTQLTKAFTNLKNNQLDAQGKERLIAGLRDFSEVVRGLLKPKTTREVGKLTQKQLEEAAAARRREAEFARLAQEAEDALANKKKTAEEEKLAAEKAEQEEALRVKLEKKKRADEQLAMRQKEKAERLAAQAEEVRIAEEMAQQKLAAEAEKLRLQVEAEELAMIAAEEVRIAEEQALKIEAERVEQIRIATELAELRLVEELRVAELARLAAAELQRAEEQRVWEAQQRIAQEQEALRVAEQRRLEREKIEQLEQLEAMERERLATLAREEAAEKVRVAELERIRVAKEMRSYVAEQLRVKTAEEKENLNRRMIRAAEERFAGLTLSCANCPTKTCAGCTEDRAKQCDQFNTDPFCRAALRHPGCTDKSKALDHIYPLDFEDTFYLWKSRISKSSRAADEEFSPLFRLVYDCARGFYEDPGLTQWEAVKQRKLDNYARAGIEAPELKSWAEKLPLLVKALKEKGFDLKSLPYDDNTSTWQIAEYFKANGTVYEKEIFKNNYSKIYCYLSNFIDYDLKRTPAGQYALALVAAQEQQQQAQDALSQLQAAAAAASPADGGAAEIDFSMFADGAADDDAAGIDFSMFAGGAADDDAAGIDFGALLAGDNSEEVVPSPVALADDTGFNEGGAAAAQSVSVATTLEEKITLALTASEKDGGAALAEVIAMIPGFDQMDETHKPWLQPTSWPSKSLKEKDNLQYYASLTATNLALNYYLNGSDRGNTNPVLGRVEYLDLATTTQDFADMFGKLKLYNQIPSTVGLPSISNISKVTGSSYKDDAIQAILALNIAFYEALHQQRRRP